jgi:hypothetical protein
MTALNGALAPATRTPIHLQRPATDDGGEDRRSEYPDDEDYHPCLRRHSFSQEAMRTARCEWSETRQIAPGSDRQIRSTVL